MIIHESDNLIVTDNVLTNLPISKLSSIPTETEGIGPTDLMLISKLCDPERMTETGYMSYKATMSDISDFMHSALDVAGIIADADNIQLSVSYLWRFYDMLCEISNASPSAFVNIYDQQGKFNPEVISAIYTDKGTILTSLGVYKFSDAMSNIFGWKKFNSISAVSGYFDNLSAGTEYATNGVFQNLSATRLSAAGLTAVNGNIQNFSASTVNVTNRLTSNSGMFMNLSATRLSSANLTAVNLTANSGNMQTANITNLTADNTNISNVSIDGQPFQHLSVMTQTAYNNAIKQPNYFYFTYPDPNAAQS